MCFGAPMIYGATHQPGNPRCRIPARPYPGISRDDEKEIIAIIKEYIRAAGQGGSVIINQGLQPLA